MAGIVKFKDETEEREENFKIYLTRKVLNRCEIREIRMEYGGSNSTDT